MVTNPITINIPWNIANCIGHLRAMEIIEIMKVSTITILKRMTLCDIALLSQWR